MSRYPIACGAGRVQSLWSPRYPKSCSDGRALPHVRYHRHVTALCRLHQRTRPARSAQTPRRQKIHATENKAARTPLIARTSPSTQRICAEPRSVMLIPFSNNSSLVPACCCRSDSSKDAGSMGSDCNAHCGKGCSSSNHRRCRCCRNSDEQVEPRYIRCRIRSCVTRPVGSVLLIGLQAA